MMNNKHGRLTMKAKRWWLSGLAGFISVLSGCGGEAMSKEVTEFDWYAVATAPRYYPMEVVNGTFFYKGQDYGVTIPSGGTLTQGWGCLPALTLLDLNSNLCLIGLE